MNGRRWPLDRRAARRKPRTCSQSHGVPHRRIEEWKYSDLKSALGEKGIGAVLAEWQVQSLPAGVEMFDLSLPNPPDWVQAHFAASCRQCDGRGLAGPVGRRLRLPRAERRRDRRRR